MSSANKLKNDEWLKENYDSIINEQLKDEIVEQCESDNLDGNLMHYLSHSSVVGKSASKTEVQVVFDAPSKCTNGICLYDCLIPGQNLNPVLNLILCIRQFKYAFFADIEKGFRQILISKSIEMYYDFIL